MTKSNTRPPQPAALIPKRKRSKSANIKHTPLQETSPPAATLRSHQGNAIGCRHSVFLGAGRCACNLAKHNVFYAHPAPRFARPHGQAAHKKHYVTHCCPALRSVCGWGGGSGLLIIQRFTLPLMHFGAAAGWGGRLGIGQRRNLITAAYLQHANGLGVYITLSNS